MSAWVFSSTKCKGCHCWTELNFVEGPPLCTPASNFQVNVRLRLSQRLQQCRRKSQPLIFLSLFYSRVWLWPKKNHRLRFCAKIGSLLWTPQLALSSSGLLSVIFVERRQHTKWNWRSRVVLCMRMKRYIFRFFVFIVICWHLCLCLCLCVFFSFGHRWR